MLYAFKRKKQPTPGTGDMAFMPSFSLPATGFVGPASLIAKQLFPIPTTPQLYYHQALTQDGLEGIPAGSVGQMPLEDLQNILSGVTQDAIQNGQI